MFRQTGGRPYEILVYDRYSELLVEREQYGDAIDVFEAFIEDHPASPWAPRYHMRIIDTLELAGFTRTVPERKADFVSRYGIYSAYWQSAGPPDAMGFIEQQLEQLLPELADHQYLLAGGEVMDEQQANDHYRKAASYYAEFAATFPDHPPAHRSVCSFWVKPIWSWKTGRKPSPLSSVWPMTTRRTPYPGGQPKPAMRRFWHSVSIQ